MGEGENLHRTAQAAQFPETQTLPDHPHDAEALLVVAFEDRQTPDLLAHFTNQPLEFSPFFKKFSEVADAAEEIIPPTR